MNHFVAVVTLKLKPGTANEFLSHILRNAKASEREEPDCHRFDVLATEDDDTFIFYEEYTNAAAFDAHHGTAHFRAFREVIDTAVLERTITRCTHIT